MGELRAREAQGYARPPQAGAFSALARDLLGAEKQPPCLFVSARDSAIAASWCARDGRVLVGQTVYYRRQKRAAIESLAITGRTHLSPLSNLSIPPRRGFPQL